MNLIESESFCLWQNPPDDREEKRHEDTEQQEGSREAEEEAEVGKRLRMDRQKKKGRAIILSYTICDARHFKLTCKWAS